MNQPFYLDARKDGERLWSRIQQSKLLVLPWNNPWRTLAKLSLVPLLSSAAAALTLRSHFPAILFAVISLFFVIPALVFFIVARRTGGLYSFFSETGFGVGCDADRITIPYSALQLPQKVDRPAVNKNCIVLPVKAETTGVVIESKGGNASPWDGKPYRRGIVSAYIKDGSFQVQASPNAMIVHLSSVIHPLSVYLISQFAAPAVAANGATAKPNSAAR
jgi:hypothetical protein